MGFTGKKTKYISHEDANAMPDEYYLSMNETQASILLKLLNQVGGYDEGPRGVLDDMRRRLIQMKIRPYEGPANGGIYFWSPEHDEE